MTLPPTNCGKHPPSYEPRPEGHPLVWLRFFLDGFLVGGEHLTLALNDHSESLARIHKYLVPVLEKIAGMSAGNQSNRQIHDGGVEVVANCFRAIIDGR